MYWFYADDAVLVAETCEDLQCGLKVLFDYCERWKLKLNILKTKVVIFRAGGKLNRLDKFYYNGELLLFFILGHRSLSYWIF